MAPTHARSKQYCERPGALRHERRDADPARPGAGVDGDEGAVRLQPPLHRAGEQLRVSEEGFDQRSWEVMECFNVLFGDEQTVAAQERVVIQKGERARVVEDHTV